MITQFTGNVKFKITLTNAVHYNGCYSRSDMLLAIPNILTAVDTDNFIRIERYIYDTCRGK